MKKVYVSQKEFCIDGEVSFDVAVFENEEDARKDVRASAEKFSTDYKDKELEKEEDSYPWHSYVFAPCDDYYLDAMVVEKEMK